MPLQSPPPPDIAVEAPEPPPDEAKTDNFFSSRVDPHFGHRVPFHSLERTSTSLSASQAAQ